MYKISVLLLALLFAFTACNNDAKEEKESGKETKEKNKEVNEEVEVIVEEEDNSPEWVNLSDHNENYLAMMEMPGGTPIVTLEFSGSFTGALEGDFDTKYLQVQIKEPYVFMNLYKGAIDLQVVKDSLTDASRGIYEIEFIDDSENGFIFKRTREDKTDFCFYAKSLIGETTYFINSGYQVYNFDTGDWVDYTLEDIKYMWDVFKTLKAVE